MRCNNCGYENDKLESRCIKCDVLLVGNEESSQKGEQKTPINSVLDGTITGKQITPSLIQVGNSKKPITPNPPKKEIQREEPKPPPTLLRCSFCGYENAPDATACSDCSKPMTNNQIEKPIEPTVMPDKISESSVNKKLGDTIDIYTMRKLELAATCYLQLVSRENETTEGNSEKFIKSFDSEEGIIDLNRERLEPDNKSITSKVQAELIFEKGAWFLQDKSRQQTTFIRASEKTALKEGDVILMGDRKFIFSVPTGDPSESNQNNTK